MQETNSFIKFDSDKPGLVMDESGHQTYPIRYLNVVNGLGLETRYDRSYYVYVYKGRFELKRAGSPDIPVFDGTYLSLQGDFELAPVQEDNRAVVVEVLHEKGVYPKTNFRAMFKIGEIEDEGRLNYIDGCTDSLLLNPVKMGDPCLNHLHFPPGIDQTQHTHPSHRIGIVASGYGECITPFGNLSLEPETIFVIKEWDGNTYAPGKDGQEYPIGQHAFRTYDKGMDVIAFHPDSDFGPTDDDHPMINRTIVEGKSASELEEIRTKGQ